MASSSWTASTLEGCGSKSRSRWCHVSSTYWRFRAALVAWNVSTRTEVGVGLGPRRGDSIGTLATAAGLSASRVASARRRRPRHTLATRCSAASSGSASPRRSGLRRGRRNWTVRAPSLTGSPMKWAGCGAAQTSSCSSTPDATPAAGSTPAPVCAVLHRIAADLDELARARRVADLTTAATLPDRSAERRRRLAEPDLDFRAFCSRQGLPTSSTPQLERAWDAWQDEKYRRGEANQRATYADNPFRPR